MVSFLVSSNGWRERWRQSRDSVQRFNEALHHRVSSVSVNNTPSNAIRRTARRLPATAAGALGRAFSRGRQWTVQLWYVPTLLDSPSSILILYSRSSRIPLPPLLPHRSRGLHRFCFKLTSRPLRRPRLLHWPYRDPPPRRAALASDAGARPPTSRGRRRGAVSCARGFAQCSL